MKKELTPLLDDHLQSIRNMQEAQTDDFFYTRLMARMEKNETGSQWNFPLKPVWLVGALTVLLAVNGFMLLQENKTGSRGDTNASSIQNVASAYDQSVSSY